ncbi:unnamed protein product [Caenorhabditis brenneri]
MVQLTLTTDNSDKVSPSLSDMPVDVIALIIERSEYKQQLILRKVSKSLRALVDKLKPACESVRYTVWDDIATILFDDRYVRYSEDGIIYDDDTIGVKRDDFETAALEDLAATLKNPRLRLKEFVVDYVLDATHYNKKYNEVRKILEPLNHQVSAERFELNCPCVLKTISFYSDDSEEVDWSVNLTEMDQIARLEQWKKAEELEFEYVCFDKFPMEHATHFKRFRFVDVDMDGEKFIRIIEYLSKLEHFEHCTLWSSDFPRHNLLNQVLGAPVSSNTTEEIFHHSIANTDYYFEFKQEKDFKSEFFSPGFVEIEKKKQRII